MRFQFQTMEDGKRRLNWVLLGLFTVATFTLIVGFSEVFWFGLTGDFSPLVGMYAVVVSTLAVIRVVGSCLAMPADLTRARAGQV